MRMLNYTGDTNPYRRAPTTDNSKLGLSSGAHRVPEQVYLDKQFVKRLCERDTGLSRSNFSSCCEPSRTNRRFLPAVYCKKTMVRDKLTNSVLMKNRKSNDPPSTLFASLEDMDFMDASTMSDDLYSDLSHQSMDLGFALDSRKTTSIPDFPLKSSQAGTRDIHEYDNTSKANTNTMTTKFGMSISRSEVMTKGKMSGMTLLDALNRRRRITDDSKIVAEHCQQPSKSIKEDVPNFCFRDCSYDLEDHAFLTVRSRLKKVKNPILTHPRNTTSCEIESWQHMKTGEDVLGKQQSRKTEYKQPNVLTESIRTSCHECSRVEEFIASPDSEKMSNTDTSDERQCRKLTDSTTATSTTVSSRISSSSPSLESHTIMNGSSDEKACNTKSDSLLKSLRTIKPIKGETFCTKSISNPSEKESKRLLTVDDRNESDYCDKLDLQSDRHGEDLSDTVSEIFNINTSLATKGSDSSRKYAKMLKLGVPVGAVMNAIQRDGVDPSSIELNIDVLVDNAGSRDEGNGQMKYESTPTLAVHDAVRRSDIEQSTVGLDIDRRANLVAKAVGKEQDISIPSVVTTLPDRNDNQISSVHEDKYKKMLKLGIPMGAIHNAMKRDGIEPPSEFVRENNPSISAKLTADRKRDNYRRTRLHWHTLKHISKNSIWYAIKEDRDLDNFKIDDSEFNALFQSNEIIKIRRVAVRDVTSDNVVKVIDPKRANNGGITLARIKMTYEEIANAINIMDISNLKAQQLSGIIDFLPTAQEQRALSKYISEKNLKSSLCECEKFMVAIMKVNDVQKKTQTMQLMLNFPSMIDEIRLDIDIKTKACEELLESSSLRKVFGIILKVGNRLNKASEDYPLSVPASTITTKQDSNANGFSIDSLPKLNQVKACDKKTTILKYIISLIQRSNPLLLNVKDDLPHVFKAHLITSDHEKSLSLLEKQLSSARSMLPSLLETTAHYDNNPHDKEDEHKGHDNEENIRRKSHGKNVLSNVESFLHDASELLDIVLEEYNECKAKIKFVLEYFSTDFNITPPHCLFGLVANFCKEVDDLSAQLGKRNLKSGKQYIMRKEISSAQNKGVGERFNQLIAKE